VKNHDSKREIAWLLAEKYQGLESAAFQADCAHLAAGVPLGYLIGHVPFLNATIYLDSYPLLPRPETEFWTEKALAEITHQKNQRDWIPKILDLCAGSGAVGVAVARAVPEALVTFGEIDSRHLPTIEKNITENTSLCGSILDERFTIGQSDLFENISGTFDFILCNPPYIDKATNTVATSVTNHEPHLALFGGLAGMEIIARILAQAPHYLTPGGQLWLEHEPFQTATIAARASASGFTVTTYPDQYSTLRYSVLAQPMAQ